jgi:hypothetical protein
MPIFLAILAVGTGGQFINKGESMKTRFTWSDTVRVKSTAPVHFRPGELAEVCGLWTVETEENALARGEAIGTTTYTIEFGDGTSVQVLEQYLDDA